MSTAVRSVPFNLAQPLPKLQNGDHLSRDEFERRYLADPNLKKAELIDGFVYMPSPVRHRHHSKPNSDLNGWLKQFEVATRGVEAGTNGTIRLDLENEPQPDDYLMI